MTSSTQQKIETNLVTFLEHYAESNSIDEGASLMNGIMIGARLQAISPNVCEVVTHALEDHLAKASSLPHEMFEQAVLTIIERFGR